ncbi:unnamed protein product, partial [Urochloa humidicola]
TPPFPFSFSSSVSSFPSSRNPDPPPRHRRLLPRRPSGARPLLAARLLLGARPPPNRPRRYLLPAARSDLRPFFTIAVVELGAPHRRSRGHSGRSAAEEGREPAYVNPPPDPPPLSPSLCIFPRLLPQAGRLRSGGKCGDSWRSARRASPVRSGGPKVVPGNRPPARAAALGGLRGGAGRQREPRSRSASSTSHLAAGARRSRSYCHLAAGILWRRRGDLEDGVDLKHGCGSYLCCLLP